MLAKNRLDIGSVFVTHKNYIVPTPVGSKGYDSFIERLDSSFQFEIGKIPAGAEHRPDIISNIFYNTPSYWWMIMLANNVSDPFQELNIGDQIKIPRL